MLLPMHRSALQFSGLFLLCLLSLRLAAEFEPTGTFSGRSTDYRFGVVDESLLKLQSPYLSGDFRMRVESNTYRMHLKNLEVGRSGRKPFGHLELTLGLGKEEVPERSAADTLDVSPFPTLREPGQATSPFYFFSIGTHW